MSKYSVNTRISWMSRCAVMAACILVASSAWADSEAPGNDGHAASHSEEGHGAHGHVPRFSDINWIYGLVGEKEGVEPSLLWRPTGMPVPLGALILNTAILFFLIGRFGGPSIKAGLVGRKERLAGERESAARMKAEAEEQLAHYEGKLAEMEADMKRIQQDMRIQAEADRERILADAEKRRIALENDARILLAQELAQARHDATHRAVTAAVEVAREQIRRNLTAEDQERLARDLLSNLQTELGTSGMRKAEVRS